MKSQSLYTQAQETLEQELGLDKLKFKQPMGYETNFRDVGKIVIPRLEKKKEERIAQNVAESLRARMESKQLLEKAKQMVEDLIEQAAGET